MSDESHETTDRPFADAIGSGAVLLDHEIVNTANERWQVWTPSFPAGACIGSGTTVRAAKEDAVKNMESLCECLMGARQRPNARITDRRDNQKDTNV
jgi:hypothetical protein